MAHYISKYDIGDKVKFTVGHDYEGTIKGITFYEKTTTYIITTGEEMLEYFTIPEKELS
jgi:hypothetical protein